MQTIKKCYIKYNLDSDLFAGLSTAVSSPKESVIPNSIKLRKTSSCPNLPKQESTQKELKNKDTSIQVSFVL